MKKVMAYDAYFIKPDGAMIGVSSTHIQTIIQSTEEFGLKVDDISALYKKNREPLGCEGHARNAIILELLKKDFVRIRYWPKNARYRIQTYMQLNEILSRNILSFCKQVKAGTITDLLNRAKGNVDIEIHTTQDETIFSGELQQAISLLSK